MSNLAKLEYLELYPKVDVYRNVLADPKAMYETMKQSDADANGQYFLKNWDPWSHFGTYTQSKNEQFDVTDELIKSHPRYIEEKDFVEKVQKAYDDVLMDYVHRHQLDLPEGWRFSGCSYSKYNDQIDSLSNKMTMQYHTDFITSQKDMPGDKFYITCTMYINDDYDGGDIEFFVDGKLINHKPVAGDILVFPSREPYFHGVKTIYNGRKFFVRNFIMTPFDGTEEWLKNQKQFGAYNWMKKEFERISHEDPRNMRYLQDGSPVEYDDLTGDRSGPQGAM